MNQSYDVAVVGGGIMGLAHAWTAARSGRSVALFERHKNAQGASIRNFGAVWVIGQPVGELHEVAMRSRQLWLELSASAGIWANPCGSLHLAYRKDEWAVLEEFCQTTDSSAIDVTLLGASAIAEKSQAANPDGLIGGMWSSTELCVNPREAIATIPRWLADTLGVTLHFETQITQIDDSTLLSADGRRWHADRIIICSGSDFETLFPDQFADVGLTRCKLQMMRTASQANSWSLGPHLAGGLTLQHYTSFASCHNLAALKTRIAEETPELNRYGVHVMASQNDQGEVILGDSHEYDDEISPFDKSEIDALIIRELRRLLRLPDWNIAQRWHGIYAKFPGRSHFEIDPIPGVKIAVAPGGAGMTLSFGLAEKIWNRWIGT